MNRSGPARLTDFLLFAAAVFFSSGLNFLRLYINGIIAAVDVIID